MTAPTVDEISQTIESSYRGANSPEQALEEAVGLWSDRVIGDFGLSERWSCEDDALPATRTREFLWLNAVTYEDRVSSVRIVSNVPVSATVIPNPADWRPIVCTP